jgi:YD repeat-containing protein
VQHPGSSGPIESTAWLEHWSLPLIETDAAGHTTRYQYDRRGQLRQRVDAHGRQVGFRYDAYGRLQTLTNENGEHDGQVISDFERDRLHREVLRTQGQLTTRSEYDRCGRLRLRKRSPTGQPRQLPAAHQKIFEYDPADHLIARQQGSQRQLLHYDATSRILATQDNTQGQQETFAYDAAANLLDGPQPGAGWVRHNKLLAYQDKRYRYDGFGRMIEIGRRGCTTTLSGFMTRKWGGLRRRIRLG